MASAGVGGHKKRVLGNRPPEGVGDGAHNAQRVQQRDVVQVHLNALGGEIRVKQDIDAGGFADCLVDHLGVFLDVQGERLVGDRLQNGRRAHRFQVLLLALDLWEAGIRGQRSFAVFLAHLGYGLLCSFIAGVDLGGVQKLRQRPLFVARVQQLMALGYVHGRSGDAHPVERAAELQVLGSLGVSLLVVVEGAVVVLLRLSGLTALE